MPHLRIANNLKSECFTNAEREFVIGCLLGDGTLSKSGKEYRLRVEHKAAHKEYVDWKYNRLQRFCLNPPSFVAKHNSYRFGTVGHPELTKLRIAFYGNNVKQLAEGLLGEISPLVLAILFLDDGGKVNNTVSFALHSYGADASLIQLSLRKFGIETSWQLDGHGCRKRLYVKSSSYATFEMLVKPYVEEISCMAYKFP